MKDKLIKEISDDFLDFEGLEIPKDAIPIICRAMQAYHEAKMKEVTDADFEEWASVQDFGYGANYYIMKAGAKMGIKAMQNGEIKHIET